MLGMLAVGAPALPTRGGIARLLGLSIRRDTRLQQRSAGQKRDALAGPQRL